MSFSHEFSDQSASVIDGRDGAGNSRQPCDLNEVEAIVLRLFDHLVLPAHRFKPCLLKRTIQLVRSKRLGKNRVGLEDLSVLLWIATFQFVESSAVASVLVEQVSSDAVDIMEQRCVVSLSLLAFDVSSIEDQNTSGLQEGKQLLEDLIELLLWKQVNRAGGDDEVESILPKGSDQRFFALEIQQKEVGFRVLVQKLMSGEEPRWHDVGQGDLESKIVLVGVLEQRKC